MSKKTLFFLLSITVLAFFLRVYRFGSFPVVGETKDEYAWTFLGASLIQTGTPISWSHFSAYQPFRTLTLGSDRFPLVRPSMDHPPLFSLIPGGVQTLTGASWDTFPSIQVIRFPMVIIGVVSVVLVFFVTRLFATEHAALAAALIYATVPAFVFSSRLVVAENALVPLELLSILFVLHPRFQKYRWGLIMVIAASVLMKVSGIVAGASVLLYALTQRNGKLARTAVIGLLIGLVVYCLYGVLMAGPLFFQILATQSSRAIGLATLHNRFFLHPTIVSRILVDGWIAAGVCSMVWFVMTQQEKKMRIISSFFMINCLFILATVGETTFHGWYDYLLYPFFAIAITLLLDTCLRTANYFGVWMLWLLLLPALRLVGVHLSVEWSSMLVRALVGAGGVPLFCSSFSFSQRYTRVAVIGLIAIVFAAHIVTILSFSTPRFWEDDEYFLPKMVVK